MTSFKRWFGAGAIVLVALALVACPALVPDPVGKITPMTFTVGDSAQTVTDVDDLFTNTDDRSTFDADSDKEGVATASISGTTLTVTPVAEGKATVTITATLSNGKTATTSFMVTVKAKPVDPTPPPVDPDNNQPRLIEDELPDVDDLKVGHPQTIELEPLFIDDEDDTVTYSAESRDNAIAMASSTMDGTLTLTAVKVGTTRIDVYARDGQHDVPVRESFSVTVVNQPPMAVREGLSFNIGLRPEGTDSRDLSPYFTDPEGDALTYSASVEPMSVATASVNGTTLTIVAGTTTDAEATVTVTATDIHMDEGSTAFTLIVSDAPNQAPVVSMEIPDLPLTLAVMDMMESATSEPLDLSMHFMDPDEMPMPLTYSSDDSDMTMIDGSMLTITATAPGMTEITITASDGAASAMDTFEVTVTAPEKPEGDEIPDQRIDYGAGPVDIDLETYFRRATTYNLGDTHDDDVVTAEVSEHMLTLTPKGVGTTEVTISASNSGGTSRAEAITVTVNAVNMKPMVKKTMPPVRLVVASNTATAPFETDGTITAARASEVWDEKALSTYFEDPEKQTLTFKVEIAGQTPTTADEKVVKIHASKGEAVTIISQMEGTATIKVTATDPENLSESQTFVITVVAVANRPPTTAAIGTGAAEIGATDLIADDAGYAGASRFKTASDAAKKAVDNKEIRDYFTDPDQAERFGDVLTFTVKYVKTGTGAITDDKLVVPDDDVIARDDAVATAMVLPDMWDGDSPGTRDKFTITVTPQNAGRHDILIVATDLAGDEVFRRLPVQVNNPPLAQGAQKEPKRLSSFDGAEKLKASDTTVIPVTIVGPSGGYFSDKDLTADSATSDTLTCSFRPSVTGDTAPATLAWATGTGNDAANNTESVTLEVTPKGTYSADFVTMTVAVWCSDGFADTMEDTFMVKMIAQASIQ